MAGIELARPRPPITYIDHTGKPLFIGRIVNEDGATEAWGVAYRGRDGVPRRNERILQTWDTEAEAVEGFRKIAAVLGWTIVEPSTAISGAAEGVE